MLNCSLTSIVLFGVAFGDLSVFTRFSTPDGAKIKEIHVRNVRRKNADTVFVQFLFALHRSLFGTTH